MHRPLFLRLALSPIHHARRGAANSKGLIIGGVLALVAVIVLVGFRHRPVPAPTGYTPYTSADHIFTCAAPAGWQQIAAKGQSSDSGAVDSADVPGGVLFSQGGATIDITTGRTVEVLKNDLLTSNGPIPDSLTGSKAAALHKQDKAKLKFLMNDVTSEPSRTYQGGFGECVAQEWRGRSKIFGWGGPQHGYLVSMVSADRTATITCQCAESDWTTLKPAFLHVINSMTRIGAPPPEMPTPSGLPGVPPGGFPPGGF